MSIVHVFICDENESVRSHIHKRLSQAERVVVVGKSEDPEQVIEAILEHQPRSVVFPMSSESFEGIEAFRRDDEKSAKIGILAITCRHSCDKLAKRARKGITGYHPMSADDLQLALAVKALAEQQHLYWPENEQQFHHHAAGHITPSPISLLSEKQFEVMRLLASGFSTKETAARLEVSTQAIDKHRAAIMQKLKIDSIAQLAAMAARYGVIRVE